MVRHVKIIHINCRIMSMRIFKPKTPDAKMTLETKHWEESTALLLHNKIKHPWPWCWKLETQWRLQLKEEALDRKWKLHKIQLLVKEGNNITESAKLIKNKKYVDFLTSWTLKSTPRAKAEEIGLRKTKWPRFSELVSSWTKEKLLCKASWTPKIAKFPKNNFWTKW